MKLIEPSFEIIQQKNVYTSIEEAARLCYKSSSKETVTSKDFVDKLIKMKHLSMLEHGTVYLKMPEDVESVDYYVRKYKRNPYSKVGDDWSSVTTNLRVLYENDWLDDLIYQCLPTDYHERRVSVKFITSIGIVRQLLRHRKFSFANESTRYCNYSSNKFNNELTFIKPSWFNEEKCNIDYIKRPYYFEYSIFPGFDCEYIIDNGGEVSKEDMFIHSVMTSEMAYIKSIELGATPQEAREVLHLATKSELIMTGFISDWEDLFNKRSSIAATGKPHPDMIALIDPLMKEFNGNK